MADEDIGSEYSPTEQKALDQGWVPKEEYMQREDADEHKWVDAGEFVRRGELFSKIDSSNRRIKEQDKTLAAMKAHMAKVEQAAYERAVAELKQKKVDALEEGNASKVVQLDDELSDLKAQKNAPKPQETPTIAPEFVEWTEQNSWYETSKPMRAFADALGNELADEGLSPTQVLKEVSKRVREEFPAKFRNPNRDKAGAVETGGSTGGKSGGSKMTLSEEENDIMNKLVRRGVLTKEQYMADLKAIKERERS